MKQIVLVFLFAITPLIDVFIYDAKTCVLEEHLTAQQVKILPKEQAIHLFSKDKFGWTSDTILVQERQEFHIKDNKKLIILRSNGKKLLEPEQGDCK